MTTDAISETVDALHRGFTHRIFYEYRDGANARKLARRYGLSVAVIEEIVRRRA